MELLQHNLDLLAIGCALSDEVKALHVDIDQLPSHALGVKIRTYLCVLHFCWCCIFEEM